MIWDTANGEQGNITVLILEDNPADAKLMVHELTKAGFTVTHQRVRKADEFQTAIAITKFDIILADYNVPGWTGVEAIRWLKAKGNSPPIILVTGSLGDEEAVNCLKQGASDYVLKDKLDHLPIAVGHAIEQQRLREARDRALADLRQSEEQYRLLFNSHPQPMWAYDRETLRFLAVNDAAIHHYGYSREEFLAMSIQDIRPEEEVPRLMANLAEGRTREQMKREGSWNHRKKNGDIIHVEITEGVLEFVGRPAALICVQDITERRILERQFLQAQKMEAVGRLAGGVAHDFNNLLMVITSSAQLIQDDPNNKTIIDKYANQICHAAEKAAGLTRQLLAFSRQQKLQPAVLNLNDVIRDICTMLPRILGEDIQIDLNLDSELHRTSADPSQLEQIVMNLAVNARDAMPDGGTLKVETQNAELDEDYVSAHGVRGKHGSYILLSISDTGVGMTQEVQAHIFEPFFTTKGLGKGTGLGLATVYGIVKQSGGWIWAYSEPGHGTTFKVYLLTSQEKVTAEQRKPAPEELQGSETVLLVEDEAMLREVTAEYLQGRGYLVLQAENGPRAQDVIEKYEGKIDVLITDMVMPGFAGTKLAEICRSRRPQTRVLIMSGYAERGAYQNVVSGAAYLQKPFSLNVLAQRLRDLLAAAHS